MNIKLLRSFIALAESDNYRSAAEKVCVTQPALTKHIQTLEKQLGAKLFSRGRHGSHLTAPGERLYPKSKEFLLLHDEFNEYIKTIKDNPSNKLMIGFGISSYKIVPELVNTFNRKNKDVVISLKDMSSNAQCQQLIDGTLDIGFLRLPVNEKLSTCILMKENFVLAVPEDTITSNDFNEIISSQKLIMINENTSPCLYGLTKEFIEQAGLEPRACTETDDIHTLLALISARNGVALLPSAARHFLPPNVRLIPCTIVNEEWEIGIAWDPEIKNPLRDSFLELIDKIDTQTITVP